MEKATDLTKERWHQDASWHSVVGHDWQQSALVFCLIDDETRRRGRQSRSRRRWRARELVEFVGCGSGTLAGTGRGKVTTLAAIEAEVVGAAVILLGLGEFGAGASSERNVHGTRSCAHCC